MILNVLMEEERIRYLLSQARNTYNSFQGMSGLKEWRDSFIGQEEYIIASLVYDFVSEKNLRPSTSIWSLSNFIEQQIFEEIKNTLVQKDF